MSALLEFCNTVERLKLLCDARDGWHSPIGKARNWPNAEKANATRVRINGRDDDKPSIEAALEIQKRLEAEYEAIGHQKRRAALDEIAHEIDTLRVKLPGLAVDAVYEMGDYSRMCREEAAK